MTERLYWDDSYLRRFRAKILERCCDGCELYLDRTAFYPTSGGQPHDTGWIQNVPVIDVVDEGERIRHRLSRPVDGEEADCEVDWGRRFDHMQQHSGQHLLSAVLNRFHGAPTVSFHLGRDISTIDVGLAALEPERLKEAERQANEIVFENRPIRVDYREASEAEGLRRASGREGLLRIVEIEGLDRSACGGTHVRHTGEIGLVLLRRLSGPPLKIVGVCPYRVNLCAHPLVPADEGPFRDSAPQLQYQGVQQVVGIASGVEPHQIVGQEPFQYLLRPGQYGEGLRRRERRVQEEPHPTLPAQPAQVSPQGYQVVVVDPYQVPRLEHGVQLGGEPVISTAVGAVSVMSDDGPLWHAVEQRP